MAKHAGSTHQSKEQPLSDSVDPDPEFHVWLFLESFIHGLQQLREPTIDLSTPEAARNSIATLDSALKHSTNPPAGLAPCIHCSAGNRNIAGAFPRVIRGAPPPLRPPTSRPRPRSATTVRGTRSSSMRSSGSELKEERWAVGLIHRARAPGSTRQAPHTASGAHALSRPGTPPGMPAGPRGFGGEPGEELAHRRPPPPDQLGLSRCPARPGPGVDQDAERLDQRVVQMPAVLRALFDNVREEFDELVQ